VEDKNNDKAFEYAKKFVDNELLAMFKQVEKNKGFGNLVHEPGGQTEADFVFHDGLCLRCIEPLRGKTNTFYKSTKFWS
jgi:hypothetical protein